LTEFRRIALRVAYHGGDFFGFQRQPDVPTIQGELESAWQKISQEQVTMQGSGRTDSKVHALGQVAHFETTSTLPIGRIQQALNAQVPRSISVRACADVSMEFHACHSAIGKRYFYLLAVGPDRPVLRPGLVAWERQPLDLFAMREAAQFLLGHHDFAAFAARGGSTQTTTRHLRSLHIQRIRGGFMFSFAADGFLYRMVRNLVGSLLEVGKGRRAPEWVEAVLQGKDRSRGGVTASPEGLYLLRSLYLSNPFDSSFAEDKESLS